MDLQRARFHLTRLEFSLGKRRFEKTKRPNLSLFHSIERWWLARNPNGDQQDPDDILVQRYQQRRASAALDLLLVRHAQALYHFLLTLSDALLAEDISQQSWLTFIEKPERFQTGRALFRTWLFGNARHSLIDELRRLARWNWQPLEEIDDHDDESWQQELYFESSETLQALFDEALKQLSFVQKEALMLQLEGFCLQDIADITGEKTETIKSRLRFARKQLKQLMEADA